ncbi:hypothetical protein Sme01_62670 [Sphaerisporangium melleum]|uniref:Uncharacterized protein n=1 Tax=Sphaerisporangium melleum TaxID=321316 RepID=A0A917VH96_9ACTN|nr:hypothetical protein [Sphaerisporangium melleum]GGK81884.1 hypothetical protein GCM10007964_25670 [Sphaerisporangium melleum]GII73791.1 hypothetical protein Sme01_62670 [Sphaerisporangium melleum]
MCEEHEHRLQDWCAEFTAAGFAIEQIVEHQPPDGMELHHPAAYATLSREPGCIAFRLAKTASHAPVDADRTGLRHG